VTGQGLTGSIGTLSASITLDVLVALTGRAIGAASGVPVVTRGVNPTLTGQVVSGAFGSLSVRVINTVSLVGQRATASVGALGAGRTINLLGRGITSSIGTISVPPLGAMAGNYRSVVFADDFTTTTTIATNKNASSGFNWYWNLTQNNASSWTVLPTSAAGVISNGNSGGGPNASPAGGILRLNTGQFPMNANLVTIPGNSLNHNGAVLPTAGHWRHFYLEAYLQFNVNGNLSTNSANGWPSFWTWNAEALKDYGWSNSSLHSINPTEIDVMESFGSIFGNTPGHWEATLANHGTLGSSVSIGSGIIDNNWHTWGLLWVPGTISIYVDNVLVASQSTSATDVESQSLFVILGTGNTWPLYVDWVRIWQ